MGINKNIIGNLNRNMSHKSFGEINLNDEFFDSLRSDYSGFDIWFREKKDQDAYVQYGVNGNIEGFLFMKLEAEKVDDVQPKIVANRILKVGTFKIDAHGTRLGERFIKIIMDHAINKNVDVCYVTIFSKHKGLIDLIQRFGFERYGVKGGGDNLELVYLKDMRNVTGDINKDYPLLRTQGVKKYLLSIYPKYHSVMFPDSILATEDKDILKDVSHTNSIHKIYVCSMYGIEDLNYGDVIVLYRTATEGKGAEYSAVATSICVVQEVKDQNEFNDFDKFYEYASRYSIFDRNDLFKWYERGGCKAIKLTYNVALSKRIVRHDLIEQVGLERGKYWGFFELSDCEFNKIIEIGKINKEIIKG